MPVALAVIPALIEPSLVDAVSKAEIVTVVQHGYAHRNHAPPGARNWELGSHRPVAEIVAELAQGRSGLEQQFGSRFVPVLVPPWNRIDPGVIERLPERGISWIVDVRNAPARGSRPPVLCSATRTSI